MGMDLMESWNEAYKVKTCYCELSNKKFVIRYKDLIDTYGKYNLKNFILYASAYHLMKDDNSKKFKTGAYIEKYWYHNLTEDCSNSLKVQVETFLLMILNPKDKNKYKLLFKEKLIEINKSSMLAEKEFETRINDINSLILEINEKLKTKEGFILNRDFFVMFLFKLYEKNNENNISIFNNLDVYDTFYFLKQMPFDNVFSYFGDGSSSLRKIYDKPIEFINKKLVLMSKYTDFFLNEFEKNKRNKLEQLNVETMKYVLNNGTKSLLSLIKEQIGPEQYSLFKQLKIDGVVQAIEKIVNFVSKNEKCITTSVSNLKNDSLKDSKNAWLSFKYFAETQKERGYVNKVSQLTLIPIEYKDIPVEDKKPLVPSLFKLIDRLGLENFNPIFLEVDILDFLKVNANIFWHKRMTVKAIGLELESRIKMADKYFFKNKENYEVPNIMVLVSCERLFLLATCSEKNILTTNAKIFNRLSMELMLELTNFSSFPEFRYDRAEVIIEEEIMKENVLNSRDIKNKKINYRKF